jgi:hypothetical protein
MLLQHRGRNDDARDRRNACESSGVHEKPDSRAVRSERRRDSPKRHRSPEPERYSEKRSRR